MVAYCIALNEADSTEESQVSLLIDFVPNKLLVCQSLVSNAWSEEFVEVKSVLDQELDVARLELHNGVA